MSKKKVTVFIVGFIAVIIVAILIIGPRALTLRGGTHLVYQADLSDIAPDHRAEVMEEVKGVIERRINALRIAGRVVTLHEQEDQWTVAVSLTGVADVEGAKRMIGLFTVLEFRELDEEGNWTPAIGTIDGEERVLSSRHFVEDTYVSLDQFGRVFLAFEWNEEGQMLSEQITGRLIDRPLAIFLGDQPLEREDGSIIAPIVRDVIRDRGVIEGLSRVDAERLSRFLNAGRIDVPLGVWVVENGLKTFRQGIPLKEENVAPWSALRCTP